MKVVTIAGTMAGLGLAVAACSGSSSSPAAPTGGNGSSNALTIEILGERGDASFSPNPASPGAQSVVWRNDNGVAHRIVANDGSFDTGDLAAGETSAPVQVPAGGLNYHCEIHPTTMFGSIRPAEGGEPPPCVGPYCEE